MLPDKSPELLLSSGDRLLNDQYELVEKVGDGSFFTVYRARDVHSGRTVAVKLLNEQYTSDREFVEHLRAEAQQMKKLDHPHIVPVYDSWLEDGRVGIATEFVRGINLKDRVRRVAPFPLAVAIDIAAAVSEAMEYAAAQGFAHGDLRPENILVTPEGHVRLTDFGVGAAVHASSRLQMSGLAQSAHYLSPEVAQGKPPSAPSDVYSVGVILFEMLSGQPPFDGDSPFAIAVKHLHDPPPLLRRFNPGVPKAVEGIVHKCLQKDPAARYANTGELLADLRSVREALRYGKPLTWAPTIETPPTAHQSGNVGARPTAQRRPRPAPPPPAAVPVQASSGEPSAKILILLPLMALVLAGAIFALFAVNTKAPKDAIVPSIRGMSRQQAKQKLMERGLGMRVVRESFDEKIEPGTVLYANPSEGTQVKQGKAVEVWVSKGPEPAIVPNLTDTREEDARERLRDAKLNVGAVRTQYDEIVPSGMVINQDPPAGTESKRRSAVSFVVSKGPEPIPPPEPNTSPDSGPPPPQEPAGTGGISTETGTGTETTVPGGTPDGTGSLTSPADGTTPAEPAPFNKNRQFDIKTKIQGSKGWSRLRIVVTDDQPRRQVVSEPVRKGDTVRKTIKATGDLGAIKIEVYDNGKLASYMQF